jgi:hypothetical protein
MSVLTDRALAMMNAVKGGTPFTGARALELAKGFINDDTLSPDETAQTMLDTFLNIAKSTIKSHAQQAAAALNDASEVAAGDDAVVDL